MIVTLLKEHKHISKIWQAEDCYQQQNVLEGEILNII